MREPSSKPRAGRVIRVFAFPIALSGVVACAAILGIDDRSRIDDGGGADTGHDGTADDGETDAARTDGADASFDTFVPGVCTESTCVDAGGKCNSTGCVFGCSGTACNNTTIKCPDNTDCRVTCNGDNGCKSLACTGGTSCTLDCIATGSCGTGASCTSDRCVFNCIGPGTCSAAALTCDASTCIAECVGKSSCDKGVAFDPTTYCGVTCSGIPSCKTGPTLNCGAAAEASIVCEKAMDICKDAKPSCRGGAVCNIECRDPSSCGNGYCCEAGTCTFDGAVPRLNTCP